MPRDGLSAQNEPRDKIDLMRDLEGGPSLLALPDSCDNMPLKERRMANVDRGIMDG